MEKGNEMKTTIHMYIYTCMYMYVHVCTYRAIFGYIGFIMGFASDIHHGSLNGALYTEFSGSYGSVYLSVYLYPHSILHARYHSA